MLFNSIEFLIFLPLVIGTYYLLPFKYRAIAMLIASYVFYMFWKVEYIVLILASTLVDYFTAINIEKSDNKNRKKALLALSICVNLGILFFFKYANFFGSAVNDFFSLANVNTEIPYLELLLPVGVSFYTFQTMSYTIDVYKGELKAEKNFIQFALFVTYWPQLVAGPIERAGNLLKQFKKEISLKYENISHGFRLILWGFFKKIVIADRVSAYVNEIYSGNVTDNAWLYWFATIMFAFQIYCDFSAYSDIAIGSARMMGIKLMENFKQPYFSASISEFWRRWHISLSTWFRDYVYIPLGGNRVVKWRMYYNLFITFFISGLWHGANWTFLAWGALHGLFLIFAIFKDKFLEKHSKLKSFESFKPVSVFVTLFLVMIGWVFFRAKNIDQAFNIIATFFQKSSYYSVDYFSENKTGLIITLVALALLLVVDFLIQKSKNIASFLENKAGWYRWSFYYLIILLIVIFGVYGEQEFIYFQF